NPHGRARRLNSQRPPRFTTQAKKFSARVRRVTAGRHGCKFSQYVDGLRPQSWTSPIAHQESLFSQELERRLDAVVIDLLIVGPKLIAAICAAMEILGHHSDWGMRLSLEPRGAANIDRAIEIKVDIGSTTRLEGQPHSPVGVVA